MNEIALGDVYICPHIRAARQEARNGPNSDPLATLKDTPEILRTATKVGDWVTTGANSALKGAGFTGSGVRGSSIASKYKSGVGQVGKGSLFSSLQSTGATGGFGDGLKLAAAGVVAAALVGWKTYSAKREMDEEEQRKKEEEERNERELREIARACGGRLLCDGCRMMERRYK